jgi:UrcA family protein
MRTAATLTSIAILTLCSINAGDAAETTEGAKSVAVHFADLDLSKTEGTARLFRRLKRAARRVCEIPRLSPLDVKRTDKACVEFALANAIAEVDRPVLTQYAIDRFPNQQISPTKTAGGR